MPLRNSLHRRNHKERSQPLHRQRLGVLEKHKDYVLRARDYHSKKDRLKRLEQKAADRNKDEFYFGMNRQRTEGGVHVHGRGNAVLPEDIVKVLKTQDENYLRTMRAAGLKKIEKLKTQLTVNAEMLSSAALEELEEDELNVLREAGIIPAPSKTRKWSIKLARTHIVFAEDECEARERAATLKGKTASDSRASISNGDVPSTSDLGWKARDLKGKKKKKSEISLDEMEGNGMDLDEGEDARETSATARTRLLKELSVRLHRDRMLRYAERELEMQRLLMGKGAAQKIAGVEKMEDDEDVDGSDDDSGPRRRKSVDEKTYKPRVYKWRAERKR